MATKLHRHFDVNGGELPPTYIEIPDEQLAEEARRAKIVELIAKSSRTSKENNQLVDLLASDLGYELPKSKQIKPVAIN